MAAAGEAKVYPEWPFGADEARRRQEETAQALGVPAKRDLDLAPQSKLGLTLLPAGELIMGSVLTAEEVDKRWPGGRPGNYLDERPLHRVRVSKPFYLGTCEVRRGEFALFVAETHYKTDAETTGRAFGFKDGKAGLYEGISWRNPGFPQAQTDDHPVICVSWNDAQAFCDWLSRKAGTKVTLPTEAQWEYACRGGSPGLWSWGDREEDAQGKANVAGDGDGVAWSYAFRGVKDGFAYTAPVGTYAPNAFGLRDMVGNVFEWCSDWYDPYSYYQEAPAVDPEGPREGLDRVLRGGAWLSDAKTCRIAYRFRDDPTSSAPHFGFRVAVVLK